MRPSLKVTGVLLGMALLAGSWPAARSTAAQVSSDAPARYRDQHLNWQRCAQGSTAKLPPGGDVLECTTYRVPRDWDNPNERKDLTIAVSRLRPTSGEASGTLFTNPGGPGAPGRGLPLLFLEARRQRVLDHFDIIGIDVRGTGDSTNTTCAQQSSVGKELDPRDRRPENVDTILDSAAYVARACQNAAGELGAFITTAQTVRDLDLLRALLGRERIDLVGYSGGTWLGANYASRYPAHVGRFVLDGTAEFTASWQKVFSHQPQGFQRRFRYDFLNYVAVNDISFGLGETAEEVNEVYETLRSDLAGEPLAFDGQTVYPVELDLLLAQAMYSKESFQGAANDLREMWDMDRSRRGNNPDEQDPVPLPVPAPEASASSWRRPALVQRLQQARSKASTAGMMTLSPDSFSGTFLSIACNDTPWAGDRGSLTTESEAVGKAYPLMGWYGLSEPCVFWKRPSGRDLPRLTGAGVPPILLVNSERDPATPIEGARAARDAFQGARLLTVTNDGDHGSYVVRDNQCVDDTVEAWLVDGTLPADGATCPGQPIPPPGRAPDVPALVDGVVKGYTAEQWSAELGRRMGLN